MPGSLELPREETRLLRLQAPSLPAGLALVAVRATLREALNQGFSATLDVLASAVPLGPAALLGQPLTLQLKLADGHHRAWSGAVAAATRTGAVGGFMRWRLVLGPWVDALALRQDSRVYAGRDALAIAADVFGDYPGARWRVAGAPRLAERAHCVQYRESDFQFVARLLASEGLHWRIAHVPDGQGGTRDELLVGAAGDLGQDLGALPLAAQHPTAFRPGLEDPVTHFMAMRRATSNAVALGRWDAAQLAGVAAAQRPGEAPGALPTLQRWDGLSLAPWADAAGAARAGAQALGALALAGERFSGLSGVRRLEPACRFALLDDAIPAAVGRAPAGGFTLLAVEHHAANNLGPGLSRALNEAAVEGGGYRNRFECVAAGTALVPPAVRCRAAPAALAARVVGRRGGGGALLSDRDHRVKAQFHFQRGSAPNAGGLPHGAEDGAACHAPGDERCGAWLRVAVPAAGAGWGTVAVPRVGAEVNVVFEDGDPDRPIVAGGLHHGADAPPFAAGEGSGVNHGGALSGLHTRAVAGGDGFNQWVLDDSRGQLRMRLHASAARSEWGLGHLVQQGASGAWRGAWRGSGIEGVTQGGLSLRAGAGLLLSTQARPGRAGSAQGTQMDAAEGLSQLRAALELAQRLGGAARAVRAPGLETAADAQVPLSQLMAALDPARQGRHPARVNGQPAQQAGGDGRSPGTQPVPAPGEPLALLDGASAVLLATPAAVHAHGGEGLSVLAQADVQLSAVVNVSTACGGTAGVYAHQGGVTARAAHGPVTLRAHADALRLLADGPVTVVSTGDEIRICAQRRVRLVGGDSALTLDGADVELSTPGTVMVRGAVHEFLGGGRAEAAFPWLPDMRPGQLPNWIALSHTDAQRKPMAGQKYRIHFEGGRVIEGQLDAQGQARHDNVPAKALRVEYEPREPEPESPCQPWSSLLNAAKSRQG